MHWLVVVLVPTSGIGGWELTWMKSCWPEAHCSLASWPGLAQ